MPSDLEFQAAQLFRGRRGCMAMQQTRKFPARRAALVIGSGPTAMKVAVDLAEARIPVTLVESADELKLSRMLSAPSTATGNHAGTPAASDILITLNKKLAANTSIIVRTATTISAVSGHVGDFVVTLHRKTNLVDEELKVGAIVVAEDALEGAVQTLQGLHNGRNVLALSEFNRKLNPVASRREDIFNIAGKTPKVVAFLLAPPPLSSRNSTSAVFCAALTLRQRLNCEVLVFFNSLQLAAKGLEEQYREARQAGVVFMPYLQLPQVTVADFSVVISHNDVFLPPAGRQSFWNCDVLVLDEIARPGPAQTGIAHVLKIHATSTGFLDTNNPTFLPVASNRKGIFVLGDCRGESFLEDSLIEASAASRDVLSLLSREEIEAKVHVTIDPRKCALCLTCVRVCPHVAIDYILYPEFNRSAARIYDAACAGCGICASECPANALEMQKSPVESQARDALLLCCSHSAAQAYQAFVERNSKLPEGVQFREIPCAGCVGIGEILRAFEAGWKTVTVLGCHEDSCRSVNGNIAARHRISLARKQLAQLGIAPERLEFIHLSAQQWKQFSEISSFKFQVK